MSCRLAKTVKYLSLGQPPIRCSLLTTVGPTFGKVRKSHSIRRIVRPYDEPSKQRRERKTSLTFRVRRFFVAKDLHRITPRLIWKRKLTFPRRYARRALRMSWCCVSAKDRTPKRPETFPT